VPIEADRGTRRSNRHRTVTHTVVWRRARTGRPDDDRARPFSGTSSQRKGIRGTWPPKTGRPRSIPTLLAYTSGTTGKPEGSAARPGRGSSSRSAREVCLPGERPKPGRSHPTSATDMGWIMGPWDRRRRRRPAGATVRLRRKGAPDFPGGPDLEARRVPKRVTIARRLADARGAAADPEGRSRVGHVVAEKRCAPPASRGTRDPYRLASSTRSGEARPPIRELLRGGTEVRRLLFSRRCVTEPIKPGSRSAFRRSARTWNVYGPDGNAPCAAEVGEARLQNAPGREWTRAASWGDDGAATLDRVLAALPRSLDARRLGIDRRGRFTGTCTAGSDDTLNILAGKAHRPG